MRHTSARKHAAGTEENDRLVAVACHAHSHSDETSLKNLRQHLVDEIIEFFKEYNRQHGKESKSGGRCRARKATEIVEAGERSFRRKKGK
jgi:inorganic pyrophosphatase